ncbi:Maf family protein [Desulfovibrio inopinatus]|uniref:Maf family protein n=1 Tax=Desulfovibrio inopinatus TaxID=102109 RepID=UPI0004104FB9|nr:Maf family protein [Desulfovibrio inopinatus]
MPTNIIPGPFCNISPIVLASGSPRRRDFLTSVGLDFTIVPSSFEEPAPEPDESPEAYASRMATGKANDVAQAHPEACIIAADSVVAIDNNILGKPKDEHDAHRMLRLLSGKQHAVTTGCTLIAPQRKEISSFAITTKVWFTELSDAIIHAYIQTKEPMDKAGAYAIQGQGAFMVKKITGSYTNVVGLPLSKIINTLLSWAVIIPRKS